MATYQIGEVAKLTGLSGKTIRHYEEIGLIPPPDRRNPSYASPGYRVYTEAEVRRLVLIKRAKLLDLSLEQLKQLVEAAGDGAVSVRQLGWSMWSARVHGRVLAAAVGRQRANSSAARYRL